MSDPTAITLWVCFLSALGLFAAVSLFRWWKSKQTLELPGELESQEILNRDPAANSPYLPPSALESGGLPPLPTEQNVPSWFYRPFDLSWMGFIFFIFLVFGISGAKASESMAGKTLDLTSILISAGFQLFLASVTIAIVWPRLRPDRWLGLHWKNWPMVFLAAPFCIGVMLVFSTVLQMTGYMEWMERLGVQQTQDAVKLLQSSDDVVALAMMAITAVFVAPVCEELVFRGYLYPAAKRFAGPWVAGICTALVFAGAHGSLAALLPLFFFGLILVVVYEKTGSIWAPMATHLCFNALTVIVQIGLRFFDIPIDPS